MHGGGGVSWRIKRDFHCDRGFVPLLPLLEVNVPEIAQVQQSDDASFKTIRYVEK